MNVSNMILNSTLAHVVFMNFLIILNYTFWFVGYGNIFGPIVILLYLSILVYLAFRSIIIKKNQINIFLFIFALLFITSFSPLTDWDARSIWLFHAKRIYFESNLFAQLDNYAEWSHNDYPTLVPAFIASLAKLIGTWNELFPKLGVVLTAIPPLLVIGKILKKSLLIIILLIFLLFVADRLLFNGYMDAILGLYLTAGVLTWIYALKIKHNKNLALLLYVYSSLNFTILSLIKNEGILMLLIIFIVSMLILFKYSKYQYFLKTIYVFIMPSIFIISWKYMCFLHNINNDLTSGNTISMFLERIHSLENLLLIIKYLCVHPWMIFFLIIVVFVKKKNIKIGDLIVIGIVLMYISSIFLIYLTTPNALEWHLQTSAERVLLPIEVLLFSFLIFKMKNLKRIF
ncbi:MAG: hypothetical protein PHV10_00965 [Sulfuricurvum sp.]|nr:hypothetical protein [Sulfuricurvum sp.]